MKKLIYLVSFLVVSFYATAQTQVIRTTSANTVADSRLRALYNFYIPFGAAPTLNGGMDSVGSLFFKTLDSTVNVRVGNNINNSWLPLASKSYVDGHVSFSKDSTFQNVRVKAYANVAALRAGTEYINGVTLALTQSYSVPADGGQGEYRYDAANTSADDSSFVIKPTGNTGSGRWLLQIRNNQVNFSAIGAKSDYSTTHTDNAWTFDKAMNFIAVIGNKCSNLYIPWGGDSYFFSRPLYVKGFNTCIIGDKGASAPRTVLMWHNTAFIQCLIQNVQYVHLENLQIRGDVVDTDPSILYDVDKIGIYLTCQFRMKNIFVTYAWGEGIRVYGNTGDPHHPSNVNQWYLEDVITRNNMGDGWAVYGPDANAGVAHGLFSFLNHRWGGRDQSWLGNTYEGCEFSYNAAASPVTCTKLTVGPNTWYYYCKRDGTNQAPTPGTSNNYWELWGTVNVDPFSGIALAWNSSTLYYGVGPFTAGFTGYPVINDSLWTIAASNNQSVLLGTYTEGGQPGAEIDGGVINNGGTQAAGVRHGMWLQGFAGQLRNDPGFYGSNFNVGNAGGLTYDTPSNTVSLSTGNSPINISAGNNNPVLMGQNGFYSMRLSAGHRYLFCPDANLINSTEGVSEFFQVINGNLAVYNGNLVFYDRDALDPTIKSYVGLGQAAPTTGTWTQGSIIHNRLYNGSNTLMWVCTVGGTPGTWSAISGTGGGGGGGTWGSITGTLSAQTDLQAALNAKEDVSNKSTTTTLGTSNTLYPTQNAVKTYVDNSVAGLGISQPLGQVAYGTGTGVTSSTRYSIADPGWPQFILSGNAAEIKFAAAGGHSWRWFATATTSGFAQANSMALFDENVGAYRFQIDGSGNVIHPAYAGTGNRLIYYDNTGMLVRSTIDPVNVGLWTASGTDIYNSNAGSVGIGMGSPTAKLHVDGAGSFLAKFDNSGNHRVGIKNDGTVDVTHFAGNSTAPTVAVGPNITGTVSVTGTDLAGEVTLIITSPSGLATNDQLFTLTFNLAYATSPYVVYSPSSSTSSTTMATSYVKSVGTTNFVLGVANSGTYAATTYKWTYHVMQ